MYLGLEGRWGEALGLAGLGTLLVRAVENFLYPILVRDRLKVPSVGIFISLLGGLLVFGWSGLVLGPVVLTTTAVLLELCPKRLAEPRPPVRNASARPLENQTARQQRFFSLFLRSEREIFRYVAALVPNVADAEDIVQQTAIALWEKFDAYDPAQPFTPWACRFALNKYDP